MINRQLNTQISLVILVVHTMSLLLGELIFNVMCNEILSKRLQGEVKVLPAKRFYASGRKERILRADGDLSLV